jgi:hypothetical protein
VRLVAKGSLSENRFADLIPSLDAEVRMVRRLSGPDCLELGSNHFVSAEPATSNSRRLRIKSCEILADRSASARHHCLFQGVDPGLHDPVVLLGSPCFPIAEKTATLSEVIEGAAELMRSKRNIQRTSANAVLDQARGTAIGSGRIGTGETAIKGLERAVDCF